jgi:hypothetical protein
MMHTWSLISYCVCSRINFHFEENPYFENDVLTKEFHLGSSGKSGGANVVHDEAGVFMCFFAGW